jgi:hypothetical protein
VRRSDASHSRNFVPALRCADGSRHVSWARLGDALPLRRHAPGRSRRTPSGRRALGQSGAGRTQRSPSVRRGNGVGQTSRPALAPSERLLPSRGSESVDRLEHLEDALQLDSRATTPNCEIVPVLRSRLARCPRVAYQEPTRRLEGARRAGGSGSTWIRLEPVVSGSMTPVHVAGRHTPGSPDRGCARCPATPHHRSKTDAGPDS